MDARVLQADPDRLNWDSLVSDGVEARQQRDGAQWKLGDLALEVETTYGGADLERYAEEIGVEYDALREYRRLAERYENARRTANLSWSHYQRIAARDDRNDWLALAAAERWTVRRMMSEIEVADQERAEAEDLARQMAALAAQNEVLAEQVESGDIDLRSALSEAARLEAKRRQDEEDYLGQVRRGVARLEQLIIGWIELEALPTAESPYREDVLAKLSVRNREKIEWIEQLYVQGGQR